jgi:hypothetical protein
MATIPDAVLLCASSPYAKRGVLWDAYRRQYGKAGPVLVWQAATRTMNPCVPESVISEAYERDPANAAAEFGAQFRSDVDLFVSREVVDAAIVPSRFELPYISNVAYSAFVDPSGGSQDSMTLAIAHQEDGKRILDLVREIRAPFSPDATVKEFASTVKSYHLNRCFGDRYGGEWPRERFAAHGIEYVIADKTRSELYLELLPLLNSGMAELLENSRLISQLVGLERRTARSGRDSVDHAPGSHDDVINAVAGALVSVPVKDPTVGIVLNAAYFHRENPFALCQAMDWHT